MVTSLELGYFLSRHSQETQPNNHDSETGGCSFQHQSNCIARSGRPLGCRVFFCESAAIGWQQELTEHAQGKLKTLHQQYGIPYLYVEWRKAWTLLEKL